MNKEHVSKYFDKSGDEKIFTTNLVENEHGFASYSVSNGVLHIINVYGDGKYWDEFLAGVAKNTKCKFMRFSTRRNPKSFERLHGYKVVGHILEKEVDNG